MSAWVIRGARPMNLDVRDLYVDNGELVDSAASSQAPSIDVAGASRERHACIQESAVIQEACPPPEDSKRKH